MEEWEDELQDVLEEKCLEYIKKGLTYRQIFGVLYTVKCQLLPNIMILEDEEDEWCQEQKKRKKVQTEKRVGRGIVLLELRTEKISALKLRGESNAKNKKM